MAITLGSAVGFLDLDFSKFTGGLKQSVEDLKKFNKDAEETGGKLNTLQTAFHGAGSTFTKGVTTPILGAGSAMLYFGTEAEKAFRKFQNQTGKSTEEAEKYRAVMEDIYADNWGESIEDVADAMALVDQQMGEMPVDVLKQVTTEAIALRDTFDIDINESIRGANAMMKQFGIDAETAYNLMIQGAQQGLNQNQDLADQISEYSVYYKQLGFSAEEMFRVLETGAERGLFQIDFMNDAIKELGIRVIDGSDTTAEGFKAIGLNADEMAQKFIQGGDSAQEAFAQTMQALRDMDDEVAQNQAGVALFGTKWEDVGSEAILALGDIQGEISATNDAFSQIDANNMASLTRSLESLAISFGSLVIPYAQAFVEKITGIIDKIRELPEPIQKAIIVIGMIAAAIGPVLLVITNVIRVVTTFKTLITGVGTLLTKGPAILGALSKAFTLMGGPVTIIMGLISALIIWLVNLWNTNEDFRNKVIEIWNKIKEVFNSVINAIVGFFQGMVANIAGVASAIQQKWQDLVAWFKQKVQDFKNIGKNIVDGIKNGIIEKWEGLKSKAKSLVDGLKNVFTGKSGFDTHSPSKWAEEVAKNVDAGFAKGFDVEKSEAVQKAEQYSQGLMQAATSYVDDMKFYNKLTLEQEIDFWEAMLKNEKLAVKEKEEINKKIYTAENTLKEELEKQHEEIIENQKKVLDEYENAIKSRADALKGFAGLFDSVASDSEVTGEELLNNLQGQVDAFKQWQENMAELEERGITGGLLEELKELGPQSAKEIEALTELTDKELEKYQELFNEKINLAEGQAKLDVGSLDEYAQSEEGQEKFKGVGTSVSDGIWAGFVEQTAETVEETVSDSADLIGEEVQNNANAIYGAGKDIMGYLGSGIAKGYKSIQLFVEEIIIWLTNKLNEVDDLVDRIKSKASEGGFDGSFRTGLSYVPYDGFVAELHEGERVLTKEENQEYMKGNRGVKNGGGDTYNFYSPKAITPREARRQMKKAKRDILGGYS